MSNHRSRIKAGPQKEACTDRNVRHVGGAFSNREAARRAAKGKKVSKCNRCGKWYIKS